MAEQQQPAAAPEPQPGKTAAAAPSGPRGPAAQDGRPDAPIDDATRKIRGGGNDDAPAQPGGNRDGNDPMRTQYERDQSSDATADKPRAVIRQAAKDLENGQVDTDLRGTPGAGAERQRELLEQERARSSSGNGNGKPAS